MKKIFVFVLLILSFIFLSSCDAINTMKDKILGDGSENIGLANPMVSCNSLDEINEKVDVNLIRYIFAEDEKYFVIDGKIAEYDFNLDGDTFTFRGSLNVNEDISGINDEENYFESNQDFIVFTSNYYLKRFFNSNAQYTIVVKDPVNLTESYFSEICNNIEDEFISQDIDPIVGIYMDSTSEKAYCNISKEGEEYFIYVEYLISDNEIITYGMNATKKDNKLSYSGEDITNIVFDGNDNEDIKDSSNDFNGYFVLDGDVLRWEQASDEALEKIEFIKNNDYYE